jgi:RimJ/RimL family protein N-acetyltransferase
MSAIFLRPLDVARDAGSLHEIFGDPESATYMTEPAYGSVEETREKIAAWTKGAEDRSWAVCSSPEGELLGRVALIPRERQTFEAACMIRPCARGRNLAARALAIVINDAFDRLGARRIFADIDPDNAASIRTFEKLGFQREGVLRATWETHIGVRDSVIMGLTAFDPRPPIAAVDSKARALRDGPAHE